MTSQVYYVWERVGSQNRLILCSDFFAEARGLEYKISTMKSKYANKKMKMKWYFSYTLVGAT
jgi:hypothetical protein